MQTDPETDEGTPEDQPTDRDIDHDDEREKLQENNWFEDPTWSPEKIDSDYEQIKDEDDSAYTTTQGKQIHKFAVESMTVLSSKFGVVESIGHLG